MKFSIFTAEKNLCILHGQVFVMINSHREAWVVKIKSSLFSNIGTCKLRCISIKYTWVQLTLRFTHNNSITPLKAQVTFALRLTCDDRTMPVFAFSCDLRRVTLRCPYGSTASYDFLRLPTISVASTIL